MEQGGLGSSDGVGSDEGLGFMSGDGCLWLDLIRSAFE